MVTSTSRLSGARYQQIARAGEYFVAAELNRRSAYAVTMTGNMPRIDVLASNSDPSRTISIQVKTRRSRTWHTSVRKGERLADPARFWVFVDLSNKLARPDYYIVPDDWMRENIRQAHQT